LKEIGLKAYRLSELIRLGYTVPSGYSITSDVFMDVIQYNYKAEEFQNLLSQPRCLVWGQITSLIHNLVLNKKLQEVISDKSNELGWPIAIRSSGVDEDGSQSSKAGIYNSVVGCKNISEIINAIKECWIASFSPLAQAFGAGDSPIPLILQKTVTQKYSGVAFSIDPLSGDDSLIVICGVKDGEDGIVSGKMSGSVCVLKKENLEIVTDRSEGIFPIEIAKEISKVIMLIKDSLNIGEVDMEWALSDETLYVLQARPVTSASIKNKSNAVLLFDLDSNDCLSAPLDQLYELHIHWFEKQFWFRKIANENGIRILKACYLRYDPKLITLSQIEMLFDEYKTPYLVIDRSPKQRTIFIKKNDLLHTLKMLTVGEDGLITVRIRELPSFDLSGFSSCLPDGRVLVEAFPGAFTGVYKYDIIPSTYTLDKNGIMIDSTIKSYNKCCKLNNSSLQFTEFYGKGLSAELTKEKLNEIVKMTQIMTEKLKEPRLEWTISDKNLFLVDMSLEHHPLSVLEDDTRILSNGNFQGKAVKFSDISILKSVCSTHTISVVPEPQFFVARDSIKENVMLSNKINANETPVIITKQPVTELALIMDSVAGFIFEEGSLLCHLGIILREAGIPAIFMENALSILDDGANILCIDGKVNITK